VKTEILSGVKEGETVVLRKTGGEGRFQGSGQSRPQMNPAQMLGGGGGGGRR
jgi:hypothetical protein